MIVVVGGVAGTGKTTVGRQLAAVLALPFLDADDFHDPATIEKMRHSRPLTEEDRAPWLGRLNSALRGAGDGAVLACSALTERSRQRLTEGLQDDEVHLVFLVGEPELLRERLEARRDHFAGAGLLASQLATVEVPDDALILDIGPPPAELVGQIAAALREGCGS